MTVYFIVDEDYSDERYIGFLCTYCRLGNGYKKSKILPLENFRVYCMCCGAVLGKREDPLLLHKTLVMYFDEDVKELNVKDLHIKNNRLQRKDK